MRITITKAMQTTAFFSSLNSSSIKLIQDNSKYLQYEPGKPLAARGALPAYVLVIQSGEARLLANDQTGVYTVDRLGEGDVVGLASLLNANGCEEVSSISNLVAIQIPDQIIISIYRNDATFKRWCDSTIFTSEIIEISDKIEKYKNISPVTAKKSTDKIKSLCSLIVSSEINLEADDGYIYIASSANISGVECGEILQVGGSLSARPPLPARIIKYQIHVAGVKTDAKITNNLIEPTKSKTSYESAPNLPVTSDLDIGQYAEKDQMPLIRATGAMQECLACLQMLAKSMDLPFRKDSIERILRNALRTGKPASIELMGSLAANMGLHASGAKIPASFATRLQTPALIPWREGFALIKKSNSKGLLLASPKDGMVSLSVTNIETAFPEGINVLFVERGQTTPEEKFGVSWFWPMLTKYKGPLLQVLLASFVVQLFGLANPLLIQVIIDKVISQRSLDTLEILGIALVVVTILGGLIGGLRTFLFSETTNRIDTRLGAEVIDHLLRLPLGYFDNRPVGELGSRVAELEKIRNFLTGQALTTILDAAFSIIYILVMVFYSWLLTIIALIVVPLQVAITLVAAPLFRRQVRDVASQNAQTQSHLVEVLTGIQTVKAQNVEMVSRWKWQNLYNKYISRTFEKTITTTIFGESTNIFQQLSQLLVLWIGAILVLRGELTLGQLIAFRIISGFVTQPLLRLSNIWQNIQELKVSFERLADIIDTPEESDDLDRANIPLPNVSGHVKFSNVSFSFKRGSEKIINDLSLEVPAGKFIGIVGQSGSGKSTLMKLLPRLYAPNEGSIYIDGYDIGKVELYSLRRQIGIVPQEPLLFSGSINENIALTDPDAASVDIVKAAKIADAHNFIMNLPNGYSSNVGERGAGLSGGQKQRIAIARTLLSKPRLLILDEATSALDYDTERRVCDNLKTACKGSTVFFITHRLSTIRNADQILMMHQGGIVERGTHNELISLKGRYYALYRQQEAT